MNLRVIKKDIEYFIGEFIDDCSLYAALNPEKNADEVSKIVEEAIDLYNELKDKVNLKIEGSKKAYYNALRKETFEKVDALYTKLSEVVKASN